MVEGSCHSSSFVFIIDRSAVGIRCYNNGLVAMLDPDFVEAHTIFLARQLVKLIEMPPEPAGTRESPTASNDWTSVTFPRGIHG
jgi:hypothetical protein